MRLVSGKTIVFVSLLLQFGWQVTALAGGPRRARARQLRAKVSETRALIGRTGRTSQLRCYSVPAFYWRLTPHLTDVRQYTTYTWLRSPLMKKLKGKEPNSIVEVYDRTGIKTDYHTAVVTSMGTVIEKRSKNATHLIEEISWQEFSLRYRSLPTEFYRPTLTIDQYVAENQLGNTSAKRVRQKIEAWEGRISPYILTDLSLATPPSLFETVHHEVFDLLAGELNGEHRALAKLKFPTMSPEEVLRVLNINRLYTLRDLTNPN